MIRIFVIFIFLTITNITSASNLPDFPFVVSTGVAEKDVLPTIATVSINVLAFNKQSDKAFEAANVASRSVIELLKKYDIDIKQLEANDIQKSTTRQRGNNYNRHEILGYEVSRNMSLTLNNLSQYSELVNDIVSIDNISGIRTQFDVSNRIQIESELIQIASKNAKNKATKMANSLDTQIHSVYAVSQASNFGDFFATFGASTYPISAEMAYSPSNNVAMFICFLVWFSFTPS